MLFIDKILWKCKIRVFIQPLVLLCNILNYYRKYIFFGNIFLLQTSIAWYILKFLFSRHVTHLDYQMPFFPNLKESPLEYIEVICLCWEGRANKQLKFLMGPWEPWEPVGKQLGPAAVWTLPSLPTQTMTHCSVHHTKYILVTGSSTKYLFLEMGIKQTTTWCWMKVINSIVVHHTGHKQYCSPPHWW